MSISIGKVGFLALAGLLAFGTAPQPAIAQEVEVLGTSTANSALRFIDELSTQTQKMSAEVMLVALNVNASENVRNLEESRAFFVGVLNALRNGDSQMGIPQLTDPGILATLNEVEYIWRGLDPTIQRVIGSEAATAHDVGTVARLNLELLAAAEEISEAFEGRYLDTMRARSIITPLTELAEGQTLLVMRMSKEFLLLAYGHDAGANRTNLIETYTQFDRVLTGLIVGDADLRLIPPPTPEINSQLLRVQRVWDEMLPFVRSSAESGAIAHDSIDEFDGLVEALYEEMEEVADLYEDL